LPSNHENTKKKDKKSEAAITKFLSSVFLGLWCLVVKKAFYGFEYLTESDSKYE